jgi:hypothetical protein
MERIQIFAIVASMAFLLYVGRLIIRGRLREEYAIVWIIGTIFLIAFSFWRNGLEIVSQFLGIYQAPNMVFTAAIFALMIYLLHISVVISKLQEQNKILAQEIAILKEQMKNEK